MCIICIYVHNLYETVLYIHTCIFRYTHIIHTVPTSSHRRMSLTYSTLSSALLSTVPVLNRESSDVLLRSLVPVTHCHQCLL